MKCKAIEVRCNKVTQCSSEAIQDELCVFHYTLAMRTIERHNRPFKEIGKMEDKHEHNDK